MSRVSGVKNGARIASPSTAVAVFDALDGIERSGYGTARRSTVAALLGSMVTPMSVCACAAVATAKRRRSFFIGM